MTREEQIIKASQLYAKHQQKPFMDGAIWADKHPKQITLSAADRGIIDEIIFALDSLSKEKMISYHKEIEFLNKIRKR